MYELRAKKTSQSKSKTQIPGKLLAGRQDRFLIELDHFLDQSIAKVEKDEVFSTPIVGTVHF